MPRFQTLEEAQRWIDDVGDKALVSIAYCEAMLKYPPNIYPPRPVTDEDVIAYIQREIDAIRSLDQAGLGYYGEVRLLGWTYQSLAQFRHMCLAANISQDDLDAGTHIIVVGKEYQEAMEAKRTLARLRFSLDKVR